MRQQSSLKEVGENVGSNRMPDALHTGERGKEESRRVDTCHALLEYSLWLALSQREPQKQQLQGAEGILLQRSIYEIYSTTIYWRNTGRSLAVYDGITAMGWFYICWSKVNDV